MFEVTTTSGVFTIDGKGRLVKFKAFSNRKEAVRRISNSLRVDRDFIQGYHVFYDNIEDLLARAGITHQRFSDEKRAIAVLLTQDKIETSARDEDEVIRAVNTLDDVKKALNLLGLRLLAILYSRGVALELDVKNLDLSALVIAAKDSTSKIANELGAQIQALVKYSTSLEAYIEDIMVGIAPNTAGLIGSLTGAKLISKAKGLKRLAAMPASRIQVLGADNAMFRHRKQGAKPPKHGIIFQHPVISKSPWWQRGKIARSLSSKLAIAARLDATSKKDQSSDLKNSFMKRYKDIKNSFKTEPKRMRIIRTPPVKMKKKKRKRR